MFLPNKNDKNHPPMVGGWSSDIFRFMCNSFKSLRGFNPAESLSLIKMNWCYYPNQHICQRRCPDFIPYWDKLILLPQSTCPREGAGGFIPCYDKLMLLPQSTNLPERVFEISWCYYPNQHICLYIHQIKKVLNYYRCILYVISWTIVYLYLLSIIIYYKNYLYNSIRLMTGLPHSIWP